MPVASWHNMAVNDAAALLKTDPVAGLGEKEAVQRLERYGPNEIRSRRTTAIPALILAQFTDLMVMVLLAATAVSIFVREYDQAVTIMAIVVLNAVLGFVQEYRADRSLAALREYSAPTARAVREGRNLELPPAALVPGDLIILEAGDRVPADARLVHSASLEVDESVLTGESVPLEKEPSPVDPGATVPERRCMVFQGTLVTRGRGRALVAATGMATEIGRIAGLLDEAVVEPTPLQIRLAGLGKVLVWVAALICSAVVALGILRGEPPYRMLMAGISLAVAAIPEGLPAVVTISLALGVQRMLSRNAIVRRLPAVETLGCATVICSDKTGTLTQNRMALVEIRSSKGRLRASDHGAFRNPEARGILEAVAACNNATLVVDEPSIIDTLKRKLGLRRKEPAGLSSSPGMPGRSVQSNRPVTSGRPVTPGRSATKGRPAASGFDRSPTRQPAGTASRAGDGGTAATVGPAVSIPPVRDPYPIRAEGDPTEAALLSAAVTAGVKPESLGPRLAEYPFDSGRKLMTVVNRRPGGAIAYVKGAPERLLPLCRLEPAARAEILAAGEEMARRALRVLAVAERSLGPWKDVQGQGRWQGEAQEYTKGQGQPQPLPHTKGQGRTQARPQPQARPLLQANTQPQAAEVETDLRFLGLVGLLDPPRPEVPAAVLRCKTARIRTVMITGDHAATALAIARETGIYEEGGLVVTGEELDRMSDRQLADQVGRVCVFARVSPGHKLRIVRAFRKRGHIVAMTGDGVNDAPALKESHIGVAMGRGGTEVAKEASSLVLADDNYATIVAAVEEGRGIYDNIRKFIRYLLGCNAGELLAVLGAIALGLPLPLKAIQILWVNLVTDGLPAMALGVDPPAKDLMTRPPRDPREGIFAGGMGASVLWRGLLIGLGTLLIYGLGLYLNANELDRARTMAFASLVLLQLFYAFECRSETARSFGRGLLENRLLVGAVCSSLGLLLLVIYTPLLQPVFGTVGLGPAEWLIIVPVCFVFSVMHPGRSLQPGRTPDGVRKVTRPRKRLRSYRR